MKLQTDTLTLHALFGNSVSDPPPEIILRRFSSFFILVDREETNVLFLKKRVSPGYVWSGHIGMVGGLVEKCDRNDLAAANREFEEELRLPQNSLEQIGDLGFLTSPAADATIHIFLARWGGEGIPEPDPNEIAFLFEVPLSRLVHTHKTSGYIGADAVALGRGLYYPTDHGDVWGVTARAIHAFLEPLLNKT